MKVVSLCNKLSRSKQKLGLETDSAEIVVQPETVVSNNTTGKTAEVSFKSVQKKKGLYFNVFLTTLCIAFRYYTWYNLYPR